MSRPLPLKPHLDHLKAQAKDLLDAHRRGDPEAFARIRASVPAFAGMSDPVLTSAAFALHDAQSAIAREYGFVSWAELRAQVATMSAEPVAPAEPAVPAPAFPIPPETVAYLREAMSRRGAWNTAPTPDTVPMLPLRNSVVFPGAVIPLDIGRPRSVRAIETALAHPPALLAIFAQRVLETDEPAFDDLHTTGCLCSVLVMHRAEAAGQGWAIVEGIRWVTLEAIDHVEPYYLARIAEASIERGGDEAVLAALDRRLREVARQLVDRRPAVREQALALIEQTADTGTLADLVMSQFPATVASAAAYASEPQLVRRVERAIARLEAALAGPPPA